MSQLLWIINAVICFWSFFLFLFLVFTFWRNILTKLKCLYNPNGEIKYQDKMLLKSLLPQRQFFLQKNQIKKILVNRRNIKHLCYLWKRKFKSWLCDSIMYSNMHACYGQKKFQQILAYWTKNMLSQYNTAAFFLCLTASHLTWFVLHLSM